MIGRTVEDDEKLTVFLDEVIERVKAIGAEYPFIQSPQKMEYVVSVIPYI